MYSNNLMGIILASVVGLSCVVQTLEALERIYPQGLYLNPAPLSRGVIRRWTAESAHRESLAGRRFARICKESKDSPDYSWTASKALERARHEVCPGCPEARCRRTLVKCSLTLPPILTRGLSLRVFSCILLWRAPLATNFLLKASISH